MRVLVPDSNKNDAQMKSTGGKYNEYGFSYFFIHYCTIQKISHLYLLSDELQDLTVPKQDGEILVVTLNKTGTTKFESTLTCSVYVE